MKIIYDDLLEFSGIVIRCNETWKEDKCEYCPLYDSCEIAQPEKRAIQCGKVAEKKECKCYDF